MDGVQLRSALVESAITVVNDKGLVGTTTKAICEKAHCNEVYIYRLFGSKESLLQQTFTHLDKELANCLNYYLRNLNDENARVDFDKVFNGVWNHLLEKREKCSFLIRYYHSVLFNDYLPLKRQETYKTTIEKFKVLLKDGSDPWWLLNQTYDVLFNTLGRILRKEEQDEAGAKERLCNLLYYIWVPHIKV